MTIASPSERTSCTWFVALLSLASTFLLSTKQLSAQAVDPFPERIAVGQLDYYAQLTGLSPQQWLAVCSYYDEYSRHYEDLEEGEIKALQAPRSDPRPTTMGEVLPLLEEIWLQQKRIRRKLRALDETLFLSIESILADSQLVGMERVRHHRRCHSSMCGEFLDFTNRPFLDLNDVVRTMQLDGAETAVIDPILTEYQRQLATLVRRLDVIAIKLAQEIVCLLRVGIGS